eukprot:1194168-Prorocentrum_minimum.AAC.2
MAGSQPVITRRPVLSYTMQYAASLCPRKYFARLREPAAVVSPGARAARGRSSAPTVSGFRVDAR